MAKKLYFGNLSYSTTDDSLKSAASQYGTVTSASVITDRMTGRSKGFGFVEMSTDEEAQAVIDALNGKELEGRTIVVNEARPQEDRPARPRGGYGGGGQRRDYHGGNQNRDW